MIRTVTGDICENSLGNAQCHEHLFIAKGRPFDINRVLYMDEFDKSVSELCRYREAGGNSIVDAQPVHCGRMAGHLLAASVKTCVNIIASTGFHLNIYYEGGFPFDEPMDSLTSLFIQELTEGMLDNDGTRLKACAGIIKAAVDSAGIKANRTYEKLFESAANASAKTGAPILVHMEKGADPFEIISYFESHGIKPCHIILCHMERTHYNADLHREVLSAGVYLCYDSINRLKYLSHHEETKLIIRMLEAGFGKQLLLSLDTTRARLKSYGADMGLDYIHKVFIPELHSLGVTADDIKLMISDNAAKALSFYEVS